MKLKKRSRPLVDVTNQQKPSPSQPSVVEMKKVDPHIRELLKVPVCSVPAKKRTAHIPQHLSGKEMIRLLEEKKVKKDQEAAEKAERKAEREEKK